MLKFEIFLLNNLPHYTTSCAGDAVNMNVKKDLNVFNVWSKNFLTILIFRILTVFLLSV